MLLFIHKKIIYFVFTMIPKNKLTLVVWSTNPDLSQRILEFFYHIFKENRLIHICKHLLEFLGARQLLSKLQLSNYTV